MRKVITKQFWINLYNCQKNAETVQQQRKQIKVLTEECEDHKMTIISAAKLVEQKNQEITHKNNEVTILQTRLILKDTLK